MRFRLHTILPLLVLLLGFMATAHSQEDMVVVDNDVFDSPRRSPSVFVHDAHNETAEIDDCSQCHHVYDEDNNRVEDESSEDQRCAECHELAPRGRKPALIKAYHLNCKGCHVAQSKGPVMCGECHRKE